jgi:hypothetical protein
MSFSVFLITIPFNYPNKQGALNKKIYSQKISPKYIIQIHSQNYSFTILKYESRSGSV